MGIIKFNNVVQLRDRCIIAYKLAKNQKKRNRRPDVTPSETLLCLSAIKSNSLACIVASSIQLVAYLAGAVKIYLILRGAR